MLPTTRASKSRIYARRGGSVTAWPHIARSVRSIVHERVPIRGTAAEYTPGDRVMDVHQILDLGRRDVAAVAVPAATLVIAADLALCIDTDQVGHIDVPVLMSSILFRRDHPGTWCGCRVAVGCAGRSGQLTDAETAFLDACEANAALAAALLALPGASAAPPRVAFLHPGNGFIDDLVAQGIDRESREHRLTLQVEQIGGADPTAALSRVAQHGEDFVLVAANGADVNGVAAQFPQTRFVDMVGQGGGGANVTSVLFADQEGAFLAGAAAALASKSKVVGFLGGADTPLLRRFEAGFTAGAHAADASVRVLVRYATRLPDYSGFAEPALVAGVARKMLRKGVDVLFPAAGDAQFGGVQAVVEYSTKIHRKLWAIGADADIYRSTA